jgi:hypothetical protein
MHVCKLANKIAHSISREGSFVLPSHVSILYCGLWFVVCGLWCVVCGLWFVVCGLWLWLRTEPKRAADPGTLNNYGHRAGAMRALDLLGDPVPAAWVGALSIAAYFLLVPLGSSCRLSV